MTIKTLVLSNGNLEAKDIDNTLESLQNIVGGYIEIPFLSETFYEYDIDMIINEEGKLIDGMNPEIVVLKKGTENILDIVYGNILFASHDNEGETVGLDEEQITIIERTLETEVILYDGKGKSYPVRVLYI